MSKLLKLLISRVGGLVKVKTKKNLGNKNINFNFLNFFSVQAPRAARACSVLEKDKVLLEKIKNLFRVGSITKLVHARAGARRV